MNQKQLTNIINSHYAELGIYIKKITKNFDIEDVHQFRVEYKKLRALLRMLSHHKKVDGKMQISTKIKRCYNITGKIRDLQLQQQRVLAATKQANKKLSGYLGLLLLQIETLRTELGKTLLEDGVFNSKQQTAGALPDRFQTKHFRHYVKKKWSKVCSLILYHYLSDDNIHSIRKNLKDLLYNGKVYKGVEKRVLSETKPNRKVAVYFKKLLDELGEYQDQCIAISLLHANYLTNLNASNRQLLVQLKMQWKKDKKHVKQLLVKRLKTEVASLSISIKLHIK